MSRPLPVLAFALAALLPAGLILWGSLSGGWVAVLALIYMTGFALLLDQMVPFVAENAPEGSEFPAANGLLVALGLAHLVCVPLSVWAIAGESGLSTGAKVALFFGCSLWMGQVSNAVGHELIHRGNRWLFRLGALIFATHLFGHHASAHRLVHHIHAASAADPNSARRGEGFYRFYLRAWHGSFVQGFQAEAARGRAVHPYVWYGLASALSLMAGYVLAGWAGVLVWSGLALHAQAQLLLSDYVQHYGLQRRMRADGRLEPVGVAHSWNAPHWFSGAFMLNAPRHSDHHAHPSRPYPALRLPAGDEAPMLPLPLPFCCTVALSPRLWRRMIHPHLKRWQAVAEDTIS
ncbi:alkane 1-monooxygenase [Neogemmobacter tilapiae]|uniref:Alkane 1-monooxygenase n=1 Tax=Neogemmobacter tilapiae TaxID=875041 RepID=A0A918TEB7_9RHOB|nr:alkane 1-monooxygenase [Gemmobacter tilapiae]GHC45051.1 alkane 1-monooxygenase [Gemmobacter tilapiae]